MDLWDRSHPPPLSRHLGRRDILKDQDERVNLDETSRN